MQKLLIVKPDDAQFIDSPETFLVDYSIELSGHLPLPSALAVYQLVIIHEAFLAHCQPVLQQCTSLNIPCFLFWENPQHDQREAALQAGFCDYLSPPMVPAVVRAKVRTYLHISDMLNARKVSLEESVKRNVDHEHELLAVQDAAILCLAAVAKARDHSTGNHILRTQHYVKALAEHLRHHPVYQAELDNDETIELFYKTASLHDIGKVAIPDAILQKPGKLNPDEYEQMKLHTVRGYEAIASAEQLLTRESKGKAAKFLKIAQQVTLSHHERWDGTGYPQGLSGSGIPVVARLMSVADVYDAMISRRPYKAALDHQEACKTIIEGRATLFDPDVVDAFIDLQDTFFRISQILEDYFPSHSDLTLHSLDLLH